MATPIDTIISTIFGDPPTLTKKPSRSGVVQAFTELYSAITQLETDLDEALSLFSSDIVRKDAVSVATTANVTLSGEQTIDGVLTSASSVLVRSQTNPAQNGVYTTAAGTWTRRADLDAGSEFPGATVFVRNGSANKGKIFVCSNKTAPTLGSTPITFILSGEYDPGALDTKEDRVSGVTPTTDDVRLPIRNKAGDTVTFINPDGSMHVPAIDLQSSRIEPVNGWRFCITDEEGNVISGYDLDGIHHAIGQDTGGGPATPHTVYYAFAEPYTDPSNDMLITWVSNSADATVMEIGIVGSAQKLAVGSQRSRPFPEIAGKYLHTALVENMSPDTKYTLSWPGAALTDVLRTARRSAVKVCVASDYQRSGLSNYSDTSLLAAWGAIYTTENCDMLLWNGDIVADDGQWTEDKALRWDGYLRNISVHWRRDGCITPFVATVGNHEAAQPDGTPNNMSGGDGLPGMITEILSCGYDTELPTYAGVSQIAISIGKEVGFVTFDTAHTQPIQPQMAWVENRLTEQAAIVRHLNVIGHSPAFHARVTAYEEDATQARLIKRYVWPIMQQFAAKMAAYWCGHEHNLAVSARLTYDYDPAASDTDNDRRWATDAINGVRQLGSGYTGASDNAVPLVSGVYDQTSILDGSIKLIAALGWDGGTSVMAHGAVNTDGVTNSHNMWFATFDSGGRTMKAVSETGHQLYMIEE